VEGEASAGGEAGAEHSGGDGEDEAGLSVSELDVFQEIALLVPEKLRPVDGEIRGELVDGFVRRDQSNSRENYLGEFDPIRWYWGSLGFWLNVNIGRLRLLGCFRHSLLRPE